MKDILIEKVSKDPSYFAWYFKKYMEFENKTVSELRDQLRVDDEEFYNLSLCKAPTTSDNVEFNRNVNKVADYVSMNVFPLLQIVRYVNSLDYFRSSAQSIDNIMLAARQKDSNNNTNE